MCSSSGPVTPDALEQFFDDLVQQFFTADGPPRLPAPGRPPLLPAVVLWGALTLGILKNDGAQAGIWRRIKERHWWAYGQIQVSLSTVYHRLDRPGPSPMAAFFARVTDALLDRRAHVPGGAELAPFATEVVALDESTLGMMARTTAALQEVSPGSKALLAGKITGVFDLRRQLYRSITLQPSGTQNEKRGARDAIADLPHGSLVIADLGYFAFPWFDDLTDQGYHWVSRLRKATSFTVERVLAEQGTTRDRLIWLGAHRADRAKHLARLVEFDWNGVPHGYLTNVLDHRRLSIAQLVRLYARRWDIELAFKLIKSELHLNVLWSAKSTVLQHQIWAVLLVAQLVMALRAEVADRAEVTVDEVSTALLVKYLPQYALTDPDPIARFVRVGRDLGFIRPTRRIERQTPHLPPEAYTGSPPDPAPTRTPRYANKA